MQALNLKADREEVLAMEMRLGNRTNTLEAAILKGLKVISDKVRGTAHDKRRALEFQKNLDIDECQITPVRPIFCLV